MKQLAWRGSSRPFRIVAKECMEDRGLDSPAPETQYIW